MKNPMPGTSRFVIFDALGCWASEFVGIAIFRHGRGSPAGPQPLRVRASRLRCQASVFVSLYFWWYT